MRPETTTSHSLTQTDASRAVRCVAQALVVDRRGGPASILMDTLSRLLDGGLSLTEVDRRFDAMQALDCFCFDLVVIGIDRNRVVDLTLLPEIVRLRPDVPVLVVGTQLTRFFTQAAQRYGASDVLDLPARAADLRRAAERIERFMYGDALRCAG